MEETLQGHARKFKSGLRSTKKATEPQEQEQEEESHTSLDVVTPTEELKAPTKKKKEIFLTTYDLQDDFQQEMYTDQTGRFPTKSSRGYQYIMVLVELDSDAIMVAPMKNRTSKEMIRTYQVLVDASKASHVR